MAQKTKTSAKAPAAKPLTPKKPAAPKAVQAKPATAPAAKARPVAKPGPAVAAKAVIAPKMKAPQPMKTFAKPAAPAPVVAKAAPKAAPAVLAKPVVAAKPAMAPAKKLAPVAAKPGAPITVPPRPAAAALAKTGTHKITAPVAPVTPKAIADKAAAARQVLAAAAAAAAPKKPVSQRHGFKTNEFIVYPAHGVGRIVGIEEQEIAGMALELFVINFDKEKLTLRVPTGKLASVGMRKLADEPLVKRAMETLKGRARIKRTMWSRRAQEYVAKPIRLTG